MTTQLANARHPAVRLIALLLMALVIVTLVLGSAGGASADDEDDDEAVAALNFYRLSSSVTALFSETMKPGDDAIELDDDSPWKNVLSDPSSGGSMVGYVDDDYNPIAGWLNSKTAQSSDAIGYNTLEAQEGSFKDLKGAKYYGYFGAALQGLGLDTTSTGLSLGFFNTMLGGIVMLLYILTASVDGMFSIVLKVMDWLNPFKLFYAGVHAVSPELANGMTGGQGPPGFLGSLSEWVGGWYQVLNDLSWTVLVPVFIAVFIGSALLFKKTDKLGGLKKLFIRLLFIGLGLPLLGSMYTNTISSMSDAADSGNAGSTKIVLSTYVDFEGWALDQRLKVPEAATIEWQTDAAEDSGSAAGSGQPSGWSQANVRDTALLINAQVFGLDGVEAVGDTDDDVSWSDAVRGGESGWSEAQYGDIISMLFRYMANEQVSASAFETESKSTLSKHARSDAASWFDGYIDDPEKVAETGEDAVPPDKNPLLVTAEGSGLTVNTAGAKFGNFAFETKDQSGECGRKLATDGAADPMGCNLSPLAIYNYLNTDFGSASLHTYSSGRSSSEATRSVHNSVSMVGTGTMSFIYWFNAVVLLGAFVTIGFGYAFAMIIGNIRRALQLVTAIPFATMGAIAGIAKVIVYSVALLMEVVITIFLYKFVQEFLISLPNILEKPFSGALNNGYAGNVSALVGYLSSSGLVSIIVTLAAIGLTIAFTITALRARKSMVKAIEEAVAKIVDKFTDTSVGAPGGGGGMVPALAGGAAAGAGAALGNRMVSGGAAYSGPKPPAGSNTGGTNGPEQSSASTGAPGGAESGGSVIGGDVDTDGVLDSDGTLAVDAGSSGAGGSDGSADHSDNSGSTVDGTVSATDQAAQETEMGKNVSANGLSNPTGDVAEGGGDIDNIRAGDGDAMDTASRSFESSAEGYKDADKAHAAGATEGAQAVGHGAVAAGRGVAGDEAGAAKSAGDALNHGGQAASSGAKAKKAEADAGKSSLDAQNTQADQKRAKQAQTGQQVSSAGKGVSSVAGAAGGASGSSGSSESPKAPSASKAPQKSGGSGQKPSAPKPQPSKTSNGSARPSPSKSQPKAPTQRQAPAQQPKQPSAPAPKQQSQPRKSSGSTSSARSAVNRAQGQRQRRRPSGDMKGVEKR